MTPHMNRIVRIMALTGLTRDEAWPVELAARLIARHSGATTIEDLDEAGFARLVRMAVALDDEARRIAEGPES